MSGSMEALSSRRGASVSQWASGAALTIALLVFAFGVARLVVHAAFALGYPFGMDYGEGIVWQQMRDIVAGSGYAPLRLFPAIVYEYPPVFHLTTAATAWMFQLDELYAGRLVSLVSTIVSAMLIGILTNAAIGKDEDRGVRVTASAMAALCFASLPVVLNWALLMRVDMLASAFTLIGMLLAVRAFDRPYAAIGAGLAFALAIYTKQTCLPAPAAAFIVLLVARPRSAWLLLASALGIGLAALAALSAASEGNFLVHILFYNMNRIVLDHGLLLILVLSASIVTLAVAVLGAADLGKRIDFRGWRNLRTRLTMDKSLAAMAIIVLALVLKTVMLPAILKSGASDNYLIDWFSGIAILIGIALLPIIRSALGRGGKPSTALMMLVAIGLPVQSINAPLFPDEAKIQRDRAGMAGVADRIRASPKPVIGDDMVLLLRGGQPVLWEPAIAAELGSAGLYDDQAFAAMVRRGDFGFFVTDGDRGTTLYDQRYNPVIADAMDAAYPRREIVGDLVLHLPAR